MATVLENLQKARDLLARKDGFIHGKLWEERNGVQACCSLGALIMADNGCYSTAYECSPEVVALASCLPNEAKAQMENGGLLDPYHNRTARADSNAAVKVVTFNNTSDQKTVVAWFDRTIAIQKEHPTEKVG